MIQQYSGAFRAGGQQTAAGQPALNAIDFGGPVEPGDPMFTTGAGLLDVTSLQPPLMSSWAIVSLSVSASVLIYANNTITGAAAGHMYGRLGKILTGLQVYGSESASQWPSPWPGYPSPIPGATPMPPLPEDPSLVTSLWDPTTDPLPPSTTFTWRDISSPQLPPTPALLPVYATLQLPQPLLLSSIGALLVGLWLTPSLLGCGTNGYPCVQLGVANATYTISTDDGRDATPYVTS